MGQLQNLLTKIGEAFAFLVPEIQAIDDEKFAQFLDDPALAAWRIKLKKIRRMKPHVLSEREERLLALGEFALDGYDDAFSQLTDVDMKFGALIDEKGARSRSRKVPSARFWSSAITRCANARSISSTRSFKDHQFTLASSLAYSVKADVFRARARNYPSALEASLFRDDVPDGGLRRTDRRGSQAISRRSFATTNCAGACSGSTNCITTTPTSRSLPRSKPASPSTKRSRRCSTALAAARRGIRRCVGRGFARALVRSLRNERQTQRRVFLRQLRRAALHPDELQGAMFSPTFTRSRTRPATPCTPGSRRDRNSSRITIIRFSWRKSRPPSTRSCSRIICSSKRRDPKDARLHHQSADRRHSRHAFPANDVRRVREDHSRDRRKRRRADARRFQIRISQVARGLLRRRLSCSIPSSIWNACASRISTARFTFTNMPPEFPPRSRCPSEFLRGEAGQRRRLSRFPEIGRLEISARNIARPPAST